MHNADSNPKADSIKTKRLDIYFRLLRYAIPFWRPFAISIFGFLIYAITQPAFAALMEYLVDSLQGEIGSAVYLVPIAVVTIIFFRGVGSFLGSYYIAKVANNIVHTLRCQLFDAYTTLPNHFYDDENSGHLLSKITYNVQQVTYASTEAIKTLVREGLTVIGLLIYLIYMNWMLSMVFIVIAPVIALLMDRAGKRFKSISDNLQTAMGNITHVSSELISNYRVVRSFGGEEYEKDRFQKASHANYKQDMKMVQTSAINAPVLQLLVGIALAVMIYFALLLMGDITPGEFIAYITAASILPKPIKQLSQINAFIQKGIAGAESIFDILDTPPEKDDGNASKDKVNGDITIKNLNFAYSEDDKQVLTDINLEISAGMTVALVGKSGSGKTTLANLIPRFYSHQDGDILIDGTKNSDFTLKNLRQHISLVTQNVTLFNDTIRNNIAYGALQDTSLDQIKDAANKANATEFIENLPEQWETLVGENGLKLSGGQKQRLAIARALLKDAPILILDEATSALDNESEKLIQSALETAMANKTTLVIAHRLSTIQNADLIVVMEGGRIVESGKHDELIALNGSYAHLHKTGFE